MTSYRNHTVAITDDTTTVTLSAGSYTLRDAGAPSIQPGMTNVLLHTPHDTAPRPVRATDGLRTATIVVDYSVTSPDTWLQIIQELNKLKRLVDGERSLAIRHWLYGDTAPVFLDVTPYNSGGTKTRHPIMWGYVDDSAAYWNEAAVAQKYTARNVTITLILAEYGYDTTTVTLKNDLTSSPGMTEDTDDDGLADGLAKTAGATATIDTDTWLIGGQSQKIVAAAGTDGIETDGTVVNSTDVAAFAWVAITSGTVRVILRDATAGSNIETADISAADTSAADAIYTFNGTTWYRVPLVSSSWSSGNTCRIQVKATGAAATFYVDGLYLEAGGTAVPAWGWMSARNIDNRNDIRSTSAALENYLNYIDVWGLIDDAPAYARVKITTDTSAAADVFMLSSFTDGKYPVANVKHWFDSQESGIATTSVLNGSWSSQADAGRADGTYLRLTSTSVGATTGSVTFTYGGATAARAFAKTDKRVFAIARTNSTGISKGDYMNLYLVTDTDKTRFTRAEFTTADTWELIDLGVLNIAGIVPDDAPGVPYVSWKASIESVAGDPSNTDFDALLTIPIDNDFIIAQMTVPSTEEAWIDGIQNGVINGYTENNRFQENVLGEWRHIYPGVTNRLIFVVTQDSYAHDLTDSMTVELEIRRNTRQLVGDYGEAS